MVKVYIPADSTTLSFGLPPSASLETVLTQRLAELIPGQRPSVLLPRWGYLNDAYRAALVADLRNTGADFLVLVTSVVWVTLPMVLPSIHNRLPRPLRRPMRRYTHFHSNVVQVRMMDKPALFRGYQAIVRQVAHRVFGTRPMYTVPELVGFVDSLISDAQQIEGLQVLLIGIKPYGPDLPWVRRIPNFASTLQEYQAALLEMCARRNVKMIDLRPWFGGSLPPEMLLADSIHFSAPTMERFATAIATGIADLAIAKRNAEPLTSQLEP